MMRAAPGGRVRGKVRVKGGLLLGIVLACACAACDPQATGDGDDGDTGENPDDASGACGAAMGDYVATYTPVSDNCGGLDALPSERYRISGDGEILTGGGRAIGDGSAPDGCVDSDASTDGCIVTFNRECASEQLLLGSADVQGDFRLDFETGSGAVDIVIAVYDGSTVLQSCQARQRVSIDSP